MGLVYQLRAFPQAEAGRAGNITLEALGAWVRNKVQKRDEHVLMEPFRQDFAGYEEPDIYEILECARPYLPRDGAWARWC